ncbi:MAG: hypothetical protein RI960_211, partial [Pseudomonadota bacterium]
DAAIRRLTYALSEGMNENYRSRRITVLDKRDISKPHHGRA